MEVAELHRKHLGGQLLFSPDGLLHIILGDGMITLDDMEEMDGLRWDTASCMSSSWMSPLVSFLPSWRSSSCPCAWMQWLHRVRPPGGRGHGLLHVPLLHTAEQPVLQQHQPASWNLCARVTRPRQVSVRLALHLCAAVREPCGVTACWNATVPPLQVRGGSASLRQWKLPDPLHGRQR